MPNTRASQSVMESFKKGRMSPCEFLLASFYFSYSLLLSYIFGVKVALGVQLKNIPMNRTTLNTHTLYEHQYIFNKNMVTFLQLCTRMFIAALFEIASN